MKTVFKIVCGMVLAAFVVCSSMGLAAALAKLFELLGLAELAR